MSGYDDWSSAAVSMKFGEYAVIQPGLIMLALINFLLMVIRDGVLSLMSDQVALPSAISTNASSSEAIEKLVKA